MFTFIVYLSSYRLTSSPLFILISICKLLVVMRIINLSVIIFFIGSISHISIFFLGFQKKILNSSTLQWSFTLTFSCLYIFLLTLCYRIVSSLLLCSFPPYHFGGNYEVDCFQESYR